MLANSSTTSARADYTINVEGHEVRIIDSSAEMSGECYLLIHGIGVSERYFAPLRQELSRSARVVCIDLPGFGASSSAYGTLSIADLARITGNIVAHVGLHKPVLVGHSMGCQVVTELCASQPDVVGRLVLIGPTVDPGLPGAWRHFGRLLRDSLHEPARLNLIMITDFWRCGPRRYFATLGTMLADRIEDRLASCTVPTVVIRGTHDPIARHAWAESMSGMLPSGNVREVAGGAHGVQYSHPKQVAAVCMAPSKS